MTTLLSNEIKFWFGDPIVNLDHSALCFSIALLESKYFNFTTDISYILQNFLSKRATVSLRQSTKTDLPGGKTVSSPFQLLAIDQRSGVCPHTYVAIWGLVIKGQTIQNRNCGLSRWRIQWNAAQ